MANTRPVVAVIGGGQLARMMAPAAAELGIHLRVLVESSDSAAAQVVVDAPVGTPGDCDAVRRLIAADRDGQVDVLTFEHEHIPQAVFTLVEPQVPARPALSALVHAQDKIVMRERLTELGVPCPRWTALPPDPGAAREALAGFLAGCDGAAVVKTARGGYDGKGVRVIDGAGQVDDWLEQVTRGGPALLAEERVPFAREIAVLVARRPNGQCLAWPVVESIQRDGVCAEVIAPAPGLAPDDAATVSDIASRIASGLGVTGVLAVEMFEVPSGDGKSRFLVNELAMRPHNSGHWTIDGSATSQFEQHLRAVLDLPLGPTGTTATWTVMANVLGSTRQDPAAGLAEVYAQIPEARVNLYGKEVRPGRKLGHVNVTGDDLPTVRSRARRAADILQGQ